MNTHVTCQKVFVCFALDLAKLTYGSNVKLCDIIP